LVVALAPAVLACTPVQQAPAPEAVAALDRDGFDRCVEPILIRNCSFGACHGVEERALRVYSVGKLRAPGTPRTLDARTAELSAAEHEANFRSAVAFSYGRPAPDDNLLLRKPLPASAGGFEHAGGALFSPDDACTRTLRAWLAGNKVDCAQPGVCR
jgi:hypothetical protein